MGIGNLSALALRIASAGSKFILVMYLGFAANDKIVGIYAIFSAMNIVFTQLAGFEINQTVLRNLHTFDQKKRIQVLQCHAVVSLCAYIIILAFIVPLYIELLGSLWLIGGLILCMEHYVTELYRLYVACLKLRKASLIIFVKSFCWVSIFVLGSLCEFFLLSIENMLLLWAFFLLIAAIYGTPIALICRNKGMLLKWKIAFSRGIDLLKKSKYLFFSAIAASGAFSMDKLLLSKYLTVEEIGSYFFLQTISLIPSMIISFTLGTTLWPKCIKYASLNDIASYKDVWNLMNKFYVFIVLVLSISIIIISPCVLKTFNRGDYNFFLLTILFFSSSFYVLAEPYKLKLYIKMNDKTTFCLNFLNFALVVLSLILLGGLANIELIASALCLVNFITYLIIRIFYNDELVCAKN